MPFDFYAALILTNGKDQTQIDYFLLLFSLVFEVSLFLVLVMKET